MLKVLTAREGACKSRACAPKGSALGPPGRAFTLIAPLGLVRPMTRTHVGLLGPCFKTGRVDHRPTRRRARCRLPQPTGLNPGLGALLRAGTTSGTVAGPARTPGAPRSPREGTVPSTRAFDGPATGRGVLLGGKNARGGPRGRGGALRSPETRPADSAPD